MESAVGVMYEPAQVCAVLFRDVPLSSFAPELLLLLFFFFNLTVVVVVVVKDCF